MKLSGRTRHRGLGRPITKAGIRDIPMIDQVYDALKAEYKVQQERGFPTPTISGMTGFIFVNEEGRLRSPEAINRAIGTITRWCNKEEEQKAQEENREPIIIPHFSCHVFRHTFCTRFCENEMNIKVIQEIMGHANISNLISSRECLTLFFKIKIDNNFDSKFYKTVLNSTE